MAGGVHNRSTAGIEPGLLRVLRVLLILQVFASPLMRRAIGTAMGLTVPLFPFLVVTLPVPLFLAALVWIPSWEGRRGRVLLPLTLSLESVYVLADKFVTLWWIDVPGQQELDGLLLLVRLGMIFPIVTIFVAWQYRWRAAVVSGFVLCAADFVLSRRFNRPGGALYPLFLVLSSARLFSVTSIAISISWLLQRQREQKAALAAANQKLTAYAATAEQLAISRERNRMARELHDTLAHSLSAVTVQLEAIAALWAVNAEAARTMLASASESARTGLAEARRALKALRASPLADEGLTVAIGNVARSAAARANLDLDLQTPTDGNALRSDQEHFLYRVAQEATSNVVRHAQATRLRVALERANGEMRLIVADNGVGFDDGAVDATTHFGLKGMQERAETMGAHLRVESGRGLGTTVRAAVPVEGDA